MRLLCHKHRARNASRTGWEMAGMGRERCEQSAGVLAQLLWAEQASLGVGNFSRPKWAFRNRKTT